MLIIDSFKAEEQYLQPDNVEDKNDFFVKLFLNKINNGNKKILYIHMPLCDGKCKYCICPSVALRNESEVKEYANNTLIEQIKQYDIALRKTKFDEVYFGGGTPSLMTADELERIFSSIPGFCDIPIKSIECSPSSISYEHLQLFKKYSFSYLSFGIQSLDSDICRWQNRKYIAPEKIKFLSQTIHNEGLYFNYDLICYMSDGDIRDLPYFKWDLEYLMKYCKPSSICIHQLHQSHFTCEKTHRLMELIRNMLALYPEYECINSELLDQDILEDTMYRAEYRLVRENRVFKHYMWNKYPILPIYGYDVLAIGTIRGVNIKSNVEDVLYLPAKDSIQHFRLRREFAQSEELIRKKKGLL